MSGLKKFDLQPKPTPNQSGYLKDCFSVSYVENETYSVGIDYSFICFTASGLKQAIRYSFEESQINYY